MARPQPSNLFLETLTGTWLMVAVAITVLCGLIYGETWNLMRMDANDPQVQMATDAASKLGRGSDPQDIVSPESAVNISRSLTPFLMVFDRTGKVVISSGTIAGKVPTVPAGVFDYTRKNGEDRFTWQPASGDRIAAVLMYYEGDTPGFVLAGRSLREVDRRERGVMSMAALAWLVALVATFILSYTERERKT